MRDPGSCSPGTSLGLRKGQSVSERLPQQMQLSLVFECSCGVPFIYFGILK
ncbi:hypothetical protein XBKB1_2850002 [Xenorhabdus bovienii str. kraussei Becker Underwood]|uniref:Uncharacterized protein n=1 Tax=Xenorhabdus bovienii str. kraussei Becker Underwood TaxID=1398204 RepID=A0A077PTU8_XENBV|nr:hypothetical protein XBKB1_2850002 [Xenorhabdus bovienii str. kraussei Becker Underwood]